MPTETPAGPQAPAPTGPSGAPAPETPAGARTEPVLSVRGLEVNYPVRGRSRRGPRHVRAVAGVDLDVYEGETLGLVGESGCGKTTLGSSIMRARPEASGRIRYRASDGRVLEALNLSGGDSAAYQREVRMVFQDPHSSLNPRMTLRDIVGEPLRMLLGLRGEELEARVREVMERVGMHPDHMRRYPHAFSGGQRQRAAIARALVPGPRLVVADEAVSALDTSVRSQILNLLQDLQDELGLTYLFVSHDLSVVEHVCDRVAVMYLGRIVEVAPTDDLFDRPLHPYTESLISAVPIPDPRLRGSRERVRLVGEVPDPSQPPPGCPFHPRCRYATDLCATEEPATRETAPGRTVACHHAEELDLLGITGPGATNTNPPARATREPPTKQEKNP
ncbi:peptide/nickel transport system ATP-binding protein [Nocardiopsis arvandica]|uniref:Peptide/nickel transport system ATP-binding protein n=1 Tax=Nocardiopsis sinuspersici TaxID=501010 RepID=A0A7Y9XBR0_9ACTN|nr:oligopeptide/dipeptide ABC transporter ATP-binding protein [Nocardiopsis sinuspersici]NYH52634.1 peptide/nickel transport system ATP-binding protein [Nocardiopsis sinuspersici]